MARTGLRELEADPILVTLTTLIGPVLFVMTALPHLERTQTAIVNVSSVYGHRPASRIPRAAHKAGGKGSPWRMPCVFGDKAGRTQPERKRLLATKKESDERHRRDHH
jgi:hypothetical protein